MKYRLKMVPDAEPNADGEWVVVHLPERPTYETTLPNMPGFHVVQFHEVKEQPGTQLEGLLGRPPRGPL